MWFTAERYWKQDRCRRNIKINVMWPILSVQRVCQIPIVLHDYLQRYSLFCVLTSILSHLMTSSVPNLHNTQILNISGTRWDMTKRKTPFFTFKGLSNSPIFQYLNFSFHRHFKVFWLKVPVDPSENEALILTEWNLHIPKARLAVYPSESMIFNTNAIFFKKL